MLKSKIFYAIAIAYIAILSVAFKLLYPSVGLESVALVLALLGFALASATYYVLGRAGLLKKEGQ